MTIFFIFLNNLSLIVYLNCIGFIKYFSLFSWFVTFGVLWFVMYHYIDSDFYRKLGELTKEQASGEKK